MPTIITQIKILIFLMFRAPNMVYICNLNDTDTYHVSKSIKVNVNDCELRSKIQFIGENSLSGISIYVDENNIYTNRRAKAKYTR